MQVYVWGILFATKGDGVRRSCLPGNHPEAPGTLPADLCNRPRGGRRVNKSLFGRSEKAFRIRCFMSKFLGVSLLSSASKKGRTWEHGPGAPCKLLSSRSFSERLERSEKAFRKGRFISKFLRVFLFCFGGKRNVPGNTRHVPPKTPFLKLLFRTPDL